MARGLLKITGAVEDCAIFGISRREHKTADAREADSPGTHGARFEADEETATGEPFIADPSGCRSEYENLGMSRGIAVFDHAIAVCCKDQPAPVHEDGANWYLAVIGGFARLTNGEVHHFVVRYLSFT